MIDKIGKITLYVSNQEDARRFWVDKLHFVVTNEQQMGPNATWLEVAPSTDAETTFVLYDKQLMQQHDPSGAAHPSVILSTKDLAACYETMKENGVLMSDLMQMPYGSMFTFTDPDGNEYLLREDK